MCDACNPSVSTTRRRRGEKKSALKRPPRQRQSPASKNKGKRAASPSTLTTKVRLIRPTTRGSESGGEIL
jgi:hypothetical protein